MNALSESVVFYRAKEKKIIKSDIIIKVFIWSTVSWSTYLRCCMLHFIEHYKNIDLLPWLNWPFQFQQKRSLCFSHWRDRARKRLIDLLWGFYRSRCDDGLFETLSFLYHYHPSTESVLEMLRLRTTADVIMYLTFHGGFTGWIIRTSSQRK